MVVGIVVVLPPTTGDISSQCISQEELSINRRALFLLHTSVEAKHGKVIKLLGGLDGMSIFYYQVMQQQRKKLLKDYIVTLV